MWPLCVVSVLFEWCGGHDFLLERSRMNVGSDCCDDGDSDEEVRELRRPTQLGDARGDRLDKDGAQQGAQDRSPPAQDGCAADDDGGDDGQFPAGADGLVKR